MSQPALKNSSSAGLQLLDWVMAIAGAAAVAFCAWCVVPAARYGTVIEQLYPEDIPPEAWMVVYRGESLFGFISLVLWMVGVLGPAEISMKGRRWALFFAVVLGTTGGALTLWGIVSTASLSQSIGSP